MDFLRDIIDSISTFDLIYLIITIFFLLQCLKKGFVLSLLSASKWLLAYVITLIIFPRIKPYVKGVIDNEYVLDIVLGVSIFQQSNVFFLIRMVLKLLLHTQNDLMGLIHHLCHEVKLQQSFHH